MLRQNAGHLAPDDTPLTKNGKQQWNVKKQQCVMRQNGKKENSMRHVFKTEILVMVIIAVTAGCASAPLKTDASTSGIRAAEEVGAADVPKASLHLQLAREELERAKELAAKDEKAMADSMLLRAEADAELAVLLSREDAERTEAEAAVERVNKFKQNNQ
jgi:hypothetical protein